MPSLNSAYAQRVAELEKLIEEHNKRYYDLDAPVIEDPEYDALKAELESLCPDSPVLNQIGRHTFGEEHKHSALMGSLAKCHSAKEILEKFRGKTVVMMPKIDGCSLAVRFEKGKLVLAATRGDGSTGELVTANAREISNMPMRVGDDRPFEVRGEAYISKTDFYGIMDQPGYAGKENGLANPRNGASGGLRQKDSSMTGERKIRFVAYEMLDASRFMLPISNKQRLQHSIKLAILNSFKFETPPHLCVSCISEEAIQFAIDELKEMDASLPYETDGVVVRLDDQEEFEGLGWSGKCPKGALAYKFESVKAKSKVVDIEWTTSRTGRICPVAIIEPTRISGSLVSRITLNNLSWIEKNDVAIGDEILFEKANEIIPRLVSVLKRHSARNKKIPLTCPSCGQSVARPDSSDGSQGIDVCCMNDSCPAQFQASIIHILEKLDIKGIAESTVEKVVRAGLVKHPYEILDLERTSLQSIGFGERQSEVICEALKSPEASKAHILSCLGIDGWGRRMFETLQKVVSLDDLIAGKVTKNVLSSVSGVGPIRASSLLAGIGARKGLLEGLIARIAVKKEAPRGTSLAGKSFCVTGTLSKGRSEVQADIVKAGGDVKSSVSAKLDYLVAGDEAGSKLDKATALGVKVISEEELYGMIK